MVTQLVTASSGQRRLSRDTNGNVSNVNMKTADSFTPYRQNWTNDIDLGLGSAGPILVPNTRLIVTDNVAMSSLSLFAFPTRRRIAGVFTCLIDNT